MFSQMQSPVLERLVESAFSHLSLPFQIFYCPAPGFKFVLFLLLFSFCLCVF